MMSKVTFQIYLKSFCFLLEPKEMADIIDTGLHKDKINCADLRCFAIHCRVFLESQVEVDWRVKLLLITLTEISQVLYGKDVERCPKTVLRFYNLTWLHHELCVDLSPTTKKVTMGKMFGTYFHSLLVHAPCQYEVVSLLSVNTEKQERLFGQARTAATMTSNRKPENLIKSVLLHLQGKLLIKVKEGAPVDSRVSRLAQLCPSYKGTSFKKSFIKLRQTSWQSHLERIAPFLVNGPGFWWDDNTESVNFFDGDSHQRFNDKGPALLHFRDSQLPAVAQRSKCAWRAILENKTLYDNNGDHVSTWKENRSEVSPSFGCSGANPSGPFSTPSEASPSFDSSGGNPSGPFSTPSEVSPSFGSSGANPSRAFSTPSNLFDYGESPLQYCLLPGVQFPIPVCPLCPHQLQLPKLKSGLILMTWKLAQSHWTRLPSNLKQS